MSVCVTNYETFNNQHDAVIFMFYKLHLTEKHFDK